jgi:hypothetical protein
VARVEHRLPEELQTAIGNKETAILSPAMATFLSVGRYRPSMTYSKEIRDEFIELRASSVSLKKISKKLKIDYNTAVNWNREYHDNIKSMKSLKMEELIEKYRMTKEMRIELFGKKLLAIKKELAKRDLSEISTPKLFDMLIKCTAILEEERENLEDFVFYSDEDIRKFEKERENELEKQKVEDSLADNEFEMRYGKPRVK